MKKISSKWIKIASLIALPTLTVAAISPVIVSCSSDNGGGSENQVAKDKWIIKDYCKYNNPSAKVKSVISQQQYDFMVNGNSWANGCYLVDTSLMLKEKQTGKVSELIQKFSYLLRFIYVEQNTIAIGYQDVGESNDSDSKVIKHEDIKYSVDVFKFNESSQSWIAKSSRISNSYINSKLNSSSNNISLNFQEWLKQIDFSNDNGYAITEDEIRMSIKNFSFDIKTLTSEFVKFYKTTNLIQFECLSAKANNSIINIDWNNIPKLN